MRRLFKIFLSVVLVLLIVIFSFDYFSFESISEINLPSITPTYTPTATPIPPTPTPEINEIKISAIGDCTIGYDSTKIDSKVSYISKGSDLSYYFKEVFNVLSQDDLTIANCETTFTNSITERLKTDNPAFHFKGPPEYTEVFKLGSVEYVNLSNNHIYDFGETGYIDTKTNLEKLSVGYFGGCYGQEKISYFKKGEITVALLGYNVLCLNYKTEGERIKKILDEVSKKSNIQIISLHWGVEKAKNPTSDQVWLAHYLIDNGADLILGHHPHVPEPIEIYNGKTIVYSLGNFTYGGHLKPQPETFIFQQNFKFIDNRLMSSDWNIIPCLMYSGQTNNYQPIIATGQKAQSILDFLLSK